MQEINSTVLSVHGIMNTSGIILQNQHEALSWQETRSVHNSINRPKIKLLFPRYKVYRGYIIFAFSVTMFVNKHFLSNISQPLLDLGF